MPLNMVNVSPLTAEIVSGVWGIPATFKEFCVLASLVQRRRLTKLCTMFGRLLGCYNIHTFRGGCCPLTEFCQAQYSLCIQVLRSPILAELLHSTRAAGVSQTLRRDVRNRITELWQRAPPIFGWAAITLGIGPHSSS